MLQKDHSFEWLVGIDGRNDDSLEIMEDLQKLSPFKVKIIYTDLHVGKSVIDNYLIEKSEGNWLLWCDSDDSLLPNCLRQLSETISEWEIDKPNLLLYCILAKVAEFKYTLPISEDVTKKPSHGTFGEICKIPDFGGDALICVRGDTMRNERFPEIDLYCPEGIVWNKHRSDQALFIHEVLMLRRYLPDGVTKGEKIKYPRAKQLVFQTELDEALSTNRTAKGLLYLFAQTTRFAIHTDTVGLTCRSFIHRANARKLHLVFSGFALGYLLWLKDAFTGSVIRTDLEFRKQHPRHNLVEVNPLPSR